MSLAALVDVAALAIVEGALVALPRAEAFPRVGRLRSPAWAALLPAMILVGTFGVLELHSMAVGLVVLAAVATPLLATVAALAVVRMPRGLPLRRTAPLLLVVALTSLAMVGGGWIAQLAASMLTAFGCMALGIAIARLIPRTLIPAAVLAVCAVDVALLASGVGQSASALMSNATTHFHGPTFDGATVGPITTDYPDLVLAAVLGGMVANDPRLQRRAATLVTLLVALYGLMLAFIDPLPATVPIALAYVLLRWGNLPRLAQAILRGARTVPTRTTAAGRARSLVRCQTARNSAVLQFGRLVC